MKKIFLIIFIFLCIPFFAVSQSRGIGVTPAEINLDEKPPSSFFITVKNLSSEKEWVEITFSAELASSAFSDPGRFFISGGASRKVLLVFDEVKERGSVRVSSSRISAEGVSTGTGVEIPVIPHSFKKNLLRASIFSSFSGEISFLFTVLLILFLLLFLNFSRMINKKKSIIIVLLFSAVFLLGTGFGIFFSKETSKEAVPAVFSEISVNLVIDYGGDDLQHFAGEAMWEGGTVLDLLLSMEKRYGISVEKRDFPGVGVFIEGIHGVRNTRTSYWQYWVNGEYAQRGADNYMLKEGDTVLWKRTDSY